MAQASDNKVSLGCGTLILIALIVMIFSRGSDSRQLEQQVRRVNDGVQNVHSRAGIISTDVHELQNQVNELHKSLDGMKQALEAQRLLTIGLKEDLAKLRTPEAPAPPPVEK